MANGPAGFLPGLTADGWDSIDWQRQEQEVRRLRSRIFKAAQEGGWPKVRNLQKLMLRSWSNTLVSVRQVTQRNAGRKTAGIDGEVALTSQARAELAVRVHRTRSCWQPRAVKRVHIPKAGDTKKLRPLGIPQVMASLRNLAIGALSRAGQPRRRATPPRPRPCPAPYHPRDQPRMKPTSRQNAEALGSPVRA